MMPAALVLPFILQTALAEDTTLAEGKTNNHANNHAVDGNLRLRYENKGNSQFSTDSVEDDDSYLLTRVRVRMDVEVAEPVSLVASLQDAHILGAEWTQATETPSTLAESPDLHEAHIRGTVGDVIITAGRQKRDIGNQRLVGSNEWANTALTNDGLTIDYSPSQKATLSAFSSKIVPVNPTGFNRSMTSTSNAHWDSLLHGLHWARQINDESRYETMYLLRQTIGEGYNENNHHMVHTLGVTYSAERGQLRYDTEVYAQTGVFEGQSHQAGAYHFGIGYDLGGGLDVYSAYNMGSGDDDNTDDIHRTFDSLYGSNHLSYGSMDMFSLQNVHNAELVATRSGDRIQVRTGLQTFSLFNSENDDWYGAQRNRIREGGEGLSSYVGSEIDVAIRFTPHKGTFIEAGSSAFIPGDFIIETSDKANTATFGYLATAMSF